MAITFPRTMPLEFVGAEEFEIERVDYDAPETSGRTGGVQAGFPRWMATWSMGTIGSRKSDEVRAFLSSLRGSQRMFYGYEVGREIPRFHQDGRPFTAAPSSWSQAIDSDGTAYLTLGGLLAGMQLSHGDYVGFEWDGWKRGLVRCIEQQGAAAGGTMTIAVEMPVPTLVVPVGATVNLSNPTCLMKLKTADTRPGTVGRRRAVTGGKIVARQEHIA